MNFINISVIVTIILSTCNAANYSGDVGDVRKMDMERHILHIVENRQRIQWHGLEQRDNFINIIRRSKSMSEPELREALERIFN